MSIYYSGSVQALNTFVSSFTLAAIAIDRYLLVVWPTKYHNSGTCAPAIGLLLVWLVSTIFGIPYFFAVNAIVFDQLKRYKPMLEQCGLQVPQVRGILSGKLLCITKNT